VAKGEAMMETEGLAKAIVEKETEKIRGFHIIGPCAPVLIQEVVNAMTSGGAQRRDRPGPSYPSRPYRVDTNGA